MLWHVKSILILLKYLRFHHRLYQAIMKDYHEPLSLQRKLQSVNPDQTCMQNMWQISYWWNSHSQLCSMKGIFVPKKNKKQNKKNTNWLTKSWWHPSQGNHRLTRTLPTYSTSTYEESWQLVKHTLKPISFWTNQH